MICSSPQAWRSVFLPGHFSKEKEMSDYDKQEMSITEMEADTVSTSRKKNVSSSHVLFQYLGKNCLIAIGPATKTFYRFDFAGAIVAVDRRDQPSLRIIPQLRQLSDPDANTDEDFCDDMD
jgi:hypothetical protein